MEDWLQLSGVPWKDYNDAVGSICVLNDNSFAVTDSFTVSIYDQRKNEWTKIYENKTMHRYEEIDDIGNGLAFNETTNELYLSRFEGITKINLNDFYKKHPQKIDLNVRLNHCNMIFAENDLQLIGGDRNDQHLVYNVSTHTHYKNHNFGSKMKVGNGYYWGGLVHIKSARKMLLFGGFQCYHRRCTNNIYHCGFNANDNKWEEWQRYILYQLPFKSQVFGYVLTPDERYIILFGGWNQDIQRNTDMIYVWDLNSMEFKKSVLKCPKRGQYRACILKENVKDTIIYGYLRQSIKVDATEVPSDVVGMIQLWCDQSFVHLIDRLYGNHWKIELSKLL